MKAPLIMLALSAATLAAGCASVAVSNDIIETRTAVALGLPKSAFTIADRQDEGVQTNFTVKTQAGKRYNCHVSGTLSVMGSVVSDAVCVELQATRGLPATVAPTPTPAPPVSPATSNSKTKKPG